MPTRTGSFPIGLRRGWSDWQKDLAGLLRWVKDNAFECLDVGRDGDAVQQVAEAKLRIGSVDLLLWKEMIHADPAVRKDAVAKNEAFVRTCADLGARKFFVVVLPDDPKAKRADAFAWMVESFSALAPTLEACDSQIVIEGWPGPGALCCTPETLRAFIEAVPSRSMGFNYDPSHLIRMGIDPLRCLREFVDRVGHVHGKDTELLSERQYDLGTEQPSTFAANIGFGGNHWRYTLPGHGCMRWTEAFTVLADAGYDGCVSIELEDAHFNGSTAGEQQGLLLSRRYLEGC